MNWYVREKLAGSQAIELEKLVERRRVTGLRRRPAQFWLLAILRSWIISATR